jgi:hypothetical protein
MSSRASCVLRVAVVAPSLVCVCVCVCVCVLALRSFNEFLAEAAKETDDFPKTLDEVAKAGIRLVVADSNDPDGVGFVQWRCAFYVAGADGSVMNFMNLFDDYLVWTMHSSVAEEQT